MFHVLFSLPMRADDAPLCRDAYAAVATPMMLADFAFDCRHCDAAPMFIYWRRRRVTMRCRLRRAASLIYAQRFSLPDYDCRDAPRRTCALRAAAYY